MTPKEHLPSSSNLGDTSGGPSEADDTVPLEDAVRSPPEWKTVNAPGDIFAVPYASSPDAEEPEPTLHDILSAVTACNMSISALTDELKGVKAEISFVRHDGTHLCPGRQSEHRGGLYSSHAEGSQIQLSSHIPLDDLENRMRCNNVHALGISERAKGKNPVTFIEQWLISTFGKDTFSHLFSVERVHSVPARPLPPGNHQGPFLFKLLN